ncbi:MAG: hypothetical protein GY862_15745 [Gammaproteobacteria bacterium]|nr:hypothetical protein [Gammaproteobacteria bacterium]
MPLDPLPAYMQGRLHIPVVDVPGSGRYRLDLNLETLNSAIVFSVDKHSIDVVQAPLLDRANESVFDPETGRLALPLVDVGFPDGAVARYRISMTMGTTNPIQFSLGEVEPTP